MNLPFYPIPTQRAMLTLQACGFELENSKSAVPYFRLPQIFAISYFSDDTFYSSVPGKWPHTKYPWDLKNVNMTPTELDEYLTKLIGIAEGMGLPAAAVGPGLMLYGAHTAAVTHGRTEAVIYTFEGLMQLGHDAPAVVPMLVTCLHVGMPMDVIKSILLGEQTMDYMLNLYSPHTNDEDVF